MLLSAASRERGAGVVRQRDVKEVQFSLVAQSHPTVCSKRLTLGFLSSQGPKALLRDFYEWLLITLDFCLKGTLYNLTPEIQADLYCTGCWDLLVAKSRLHREHGCRLRSWSYLTRGFHCHRGVGRNSTGGKISFNNGNNTVIKVMIIPLWWSVQPVTSTWETGMRLRRFGRWDL